MNSARTMVFVAGLLASTVPSAGAQQKAGPSFKCDAHSVATQPLAQIICSSDELSSEEMRYVIAYQALRHSLDEAGKQSLAKAANQLVVTTADTCQIPKSGRVTGTVPPATISCIKRSFDIARRNISDRLRGDAAIEANLTPGDALKIQRALKEQGILPGDETVDGVFGPATRTAILQYQRLHQQATTGYASLEMFSARLATVGTKPREGYDYGALVQPPASSAQLPPPAPLDDAKPSQSYDYGSRAAPQPSHREEQRQEEFRRREAFQMAEVRSQQDESNRRLEIVRLEAERAQVLQEAARINSQAEAKKAAEQTRKEQEARESERKSVAEEKERNRIALLVTSTERVEELRRTCKPTSEPAGVISSFADKSAAIRAVANNALPLTDAITVILPFVVDGKDKKAAAALAARLVAESIRWNASPGDFFSKRSSFVKSMQLLQQNCLFDALDYLGSKNADLLGVEVNAALGYETPTPDIDAKTVLQLLRPSDLERAMSASQVGGGETYVMEDKRQADAEQQLKAALERKRLDQEKKQLEKREQLNAQRQAEVERMQAEEKRKRETEYPYYALVSCGRSSSENLNVLACFSGKPDTELELKNGNNYGLYKSYSIGSLGTQTRSGLHIDLRNNFSLQVQNANGSLLLSVTIFETGTNNKVFEKSVSRFGVISVKN